jgi:hypothetical protein
MRPGVTSRHNSHGKSTISSNINDPVLHSVNDRGGRVATKLVQTGEKLPDREDLRSRYRAVNAIDLPRLNTPDDQAAVRISKARDTLR